MILAHGKYLLQYSIITVLILVVLLIGKAYAQTPIANYDELKKLQHLNTSKSRLLVDRLLRQVNTSEYLVLQAPIYAYVAKLKTKSGHLAEGDRYLLRAISALEFVENDNLVIDSLESISWIFFIRGDYSQAILYVQKMTDHAFKTGNVRGQIIALNRLAISYIELELFELAIEPLQTALSLSRQTKNQDHEFLATLYLINARINLDNVNPQDTLALTLVAEKISSKFNNNDGYLARLKGVVNQQIGDFVVAEQWLKLAEEKAKKNHDVRLLQMVNESMARLYFSNNKPRLALDYAMASLDYNNQMEHTKSRADIHYLLSSIHQQLGEDKMSLKYLRAYADHQRSANDKNTVSLISTMDKHTETLRRQQKFTELENLLLTSKVEAKANENKKQFFLFLFIVLVQMFLFFVIIFILHHRVLKAQATRLMKDELTGVFCRSYLTSYLPAVQSQFERELDKELSLGVLIIDCDDFKLLNDTFGHAGGDKALKAIVNTISAHIREHDLLLRWGGDEFVLICESVSAIQMSELAKRIIRSISGMQITHNETTLTVTVSVGYALHDKAKSFNFDDLINTADKFLLVCKKSGKNNCFGDDSNAISMNSIANRLSYEQV